MYLKSLTLRGFKSFASATTLQLEPGITCVVGPNGSGKSNVVDALAWVMGEQGAKSLRGGKMEDVIFAGTAGRAPLGRAEVVLTIDNSDGALPIEYTEVTIARTMFRNGGSEYAINGATCRLLDVQELLSDSGIGREMHVIVGQGQLDSVLRATPEERRGFIEEAAGVLKHRKRKEKALRKLDATQGNLTRLGDVLTELRRQLKPLGRQAEVARRAAVIQADVRDARARLLADDLVQAQQAIVTELADEQALRARRAAVEASIAEARRREMELEDVLRDDAPRLAAAQDAWYALSAVRERLRGTRNLAAERVRLAQAEADEPTSGRDPEELEAEAARARDQHRGLAAQVIDATAALEVAVAARSSAETLYSDEERRIAGLVRAAADRREGLARLTGQVGAVRSRAEAAEAEIGRLASARDEAVQRADLAQREFAELELRVAGLTAGESGLDTTLEAAEAALATIDFEVAQVSAALQDAERRQAGLSARAEALEHGLHRKDGAGALLDADLGGVLGSVAALLTVRPGYETAVAAALGPIADAVAVDGIDAAVDALEHLRRDDLGRAGFLVGSAAGVSSPAAPSGSLALADLIDGPPALLASVSALTAEVVVVDDLATARRLVRSADHLIAVTRDGDLVGARTARGGSSSTQSLLEARAAADQARTECDAVIHEAERLRFAQQGLAERRVAAQIAVDAALEALHESDAELAAVAEALGRLGSTARAAREESERLTGAIATAEQARDTAVAGLDELEDRLRQAEAAPEDEPDTAPLEQLAEAASTARRAETEARLLLRTHEERARALESQVASLVEAAEAERVARRRAAERRERRRREAETARAVITAADHVLTVIEGSITEAGALRTTIEQSRLGSESALREVRQELRDLGTTLDQLTDSVHRDEIARAELRLRLEGLQARALEELGLEPEALMADYGPDVPVPVLSVDASDEPDADAHAGAPAAPTTVPYVRDQQAKRLRTAERDLALLGKVNPLALEEFSALEERHSFLSEQLADLRSTRQDLLSIVEEVDAKVEQVFTEAWYDVEREFAEVFSRLFPGGEGRLVLTDPQNMLTTGIEVEARPPGKKVKRLSLLSGGERSLVAVAFLVALFKARPSPFYILDEVEAALDDTNLGRLLEIYEELRANSQLIVITHQKRTMEVADALYGVSMRGDGVSAVISQRLREEAAS